MPAKFTKGDQCALMTVLYCLFLYFQNVEGSEFRISGTGQQELIDLLKLVMLKLNWFFTPVIDTGHILLPEYIPGNFEIGCSPFAAWLKMAAFCPLIPCIDENKIFIITESPELLNNMLQPLPV